MNDLKILLATAEASPFAKTGGLGDVMGGLPVELGRIGDNEAAVFMPKYSCIPHEYTEKMKYITHFYFPLGWRQAYCGVFELEMNNYKVYFLDNEQYFKREGLYGYGDDIERFSFLSKAILEAARQIDFQPDVINCNDWHVASIPVLLDAYYRKDPFFRDVRTVMTIHNLKFQGLCGKDELFELLSLSDYYYTNDKLEFNGCANIMKGGLVYADRISTVSMTYVEEIKTQYFGENLDGLLSARSGQLTGIVNGIDYNTYSPSKDGMIFKKYNTRTVKSGKEHNKNELRREIGLPLYDDTPLVGVVSRLTEQKGVDLMRSVMDELLNCGIQMVVLGTGDAQYENMFKHYAWKYPDKIKSLIYFSDEMAHKIYAASDMFLMPSKFEPCGLSQLISFRYGTLPVVREVGGLKDTVIPYNEYTGEGDGFSFANYNAHEMLFTVKRATALYKDNRKVWDSLVTHAMKQDFSWKASAKQYDRMYRELCGIE